MTEAAAAYADTFDATAGALCTGYIGIFELTTAEGRYCVWLTGSGGEPDDLRAEGLDSWRVEGMVRRVIRDLGCENVTQEGD